MNKEIMDHVDNALNDVRSLFIKAATRIEALKPGEKVPATELASDLAREQGQTGPQVYPVLKLLLSNYPGVKILRGAHGGIYRALSVTAPVDNPKTDVDDGGV